MTARRFPHVEDDNAEISCVSASRCRRSIPQPAFSEGDVRQQLGDVAPMLQEFVAVESGMPVHAAHGGYRKMVWSFGDSMAEAMTYQNGIVLVVNPPDRAWVWDAVSYITALSDDPGKIEYTFSPGTRFLVQSVEQETVNGKPVTLITMQVQ